MIVSELKSKAIEFIIVAIILGGVFYASKTAWQNSNTLELVGDDINSIKKSLITMLLEKSPDKAGIVKELVSDTGLIEGAQEFKVGNYASAISVWEDAASRGERDSVYAIVVANDVLNSMLVGSELSDDQRASINAAIKTIPEVTEENGVYVLANKKE